MASIRRHGSKWQVQIRRKGHRAFSKSFVVREDALKWARKQETLLDRGELEIPLLSTIMLSCLLERYEQEILPSKKSGSTKFHLRQISRHSIAKMKVSDLTAELIVNFRDARLKSVSGSTVRKELSLLGTILKHASAEWSVRFNEKIISSIRKPASAKGRERRLDQTEMKSIQEAFGQCRNKSINHIFLFAIETAMRRGEILSLTWKNIDFEKRTAFLPLTKNGDDRTIPLSPKAIEILEIVKADSKSELVFPISANALRLSWERVKRRMGIEDLRFHDLRHEAISRYFELGLSVPEVALISGHKDARMLFRYTHLKADDLAKKLENISSKSNLEK